MKISEIVKGYALKEPDVRAALMAVLEQRGLPTDKVLEVDSIQSDLLADVLFCLGISFDDADGFFAEEESPIASPPSPRQPSPQSKKSQSPGMEGGLAQSSPEAIAANAATNDAATISLEELQDESCADRAEILGQLAAIEANERYHASRLAVQQQLTLAGIERNREALQQHLTNFQRRRAEAAEASRQRLSEIYEASRINREVCEALAEQARAAISAHHREVGKK
jgi:hypothetical protein